jgi:3-hydroxyisobutyrate dehydrogenase
MDLAFIGLGIMGKSMAGHLASAGHQVTVHSRTRASGDELVARGARWAATPRDAVRHAEVAFICVTDTPDVEAVVLGPGGIREGAHRGLVVVDHSTISPSATRRFAAELFAAGASFLDAPVSGGDVGARNATLSIMVGGDADAFARVKPLLEHLGKTIVHTGGSGTGQLTKLVNQVLVSVTNLAVCEALSFARRSGLDLERTLAAVAAGAAGSWQLSNLGPKMIAGDFRPGFMIDLQQKDLRLVVEAAEEVGMHPRAVAAVRELFGRAQEAGMGREGTQALFKVVETAE